MASREITASGFLSVSKEITGGSLLLFAAARVCLHARDVVYCFLFVLVSPARCSRGDASRVMVIMFTFTSDSGSAWLLPSFPPFLLPSPPHIVYADVQTRCACVYARVCSDQLFTAVVEMDTLL